MPQPVPMSRAVRARRVSCRRARVWEAPPTPSTWSSGSGPSRAASSRSLAIHHSTSPRRRRRPEASRARRGSRHPPRSPAVRARPLRRRATSAAPPRRHRAGRAARAPQTTQHGERIAALTQRARGRAADPLATASSAWGPQAARRAARSCSPRCGGRRRGPGTAGDRVREAPVHSTVCARLSGGL